MEIFGSIIVFIIGLVLALWSGAESKEVVCWGYPSERNPLVILIPVFCLGIYLMYLPFS